MVYGYYRNVYFYKDLKSQLWVIPDHMMTFKGDIKENIDLLEDLMEYVDSLPEGFQAAA